MMTGISVAVISLFVGILLGDAVVRWGNPHCPCSMCAFFKRIGVPWR